MHDAPPPYATVVFDCDSTLARIEGIEDLAGAEHAGALARMTADAMEGRTPLEEVYGRRLELIRPDRTRVEAIAQRYADTALPHATELVRALRALGKQVAVVSGGLMQAVQPFARGLGIDPDLVRAVDMRFDEGGSYAGFDEDSPLARSGGKVQVVRELVGGCTSALIGDGVTDLEAAGEVTRFIAFGGVERRAAVFAAARHAVDAPDLAALLPLLCSEAEIDELRTRSDLSSLGSLLSNLPTGHSPSA